ncbi:SDR family NAD(P)-dependent oxidoreductase [Chelatococcus reniformis]|uniref:3-oxoacyl-ACP reductase n=1 Tax=Chelatococcus reniformis TaxID=1494448 RepID=A0A916XKF0_9HYPH|nr:SDR family NAD(P)-dependent oxidoreductase [Chelatococcus reniformis]GGC78240.1 3-oxoacyl-ACP reductase [Chelatococcus reniformis]
MADRLALIIGGGSGLGRAASIALAGQGMTIAVADLNEAASDETASLLPGTGHGSYRVDVTDEASVVALFEAVEASRGPAAVLANFAGLLIARDGARTGLVHTSLDEWERSFAVNARGCFLVVREMLRRRAAAPVAHGRIITVSSLAGQVGGVRGSAAYSAAKGAVLTLTKTAAREGGPLGVTVNAIAPGMIETPMLRLVLSREDEAAAAAALPAGRIGRPEEIAAAVVYLASEAADFVTGAVLDINGGQSMR